MFLCLSVSLSSSLCLFISLCDACAGPHREPLHHYKRYLCKGESMGRRGKGELTCNLQRHSIPKRLSEMNCPLASSRKERKQNGKMYLKQYTPCYCCLHTTLMTLCSCVPLASCSPTFVVTIARLSLRSTALTNCSHTCFTQPPSCTMGESARLACAQ